VTVATVRDFHLLLPAGWIRIPLDARVNERVVTIVGDRVRDFPADRRETARHALTELLTGAVRDAEAGGGIDVFLSVGAVNGVPVTASCLVTLLRGADIEPLALEDQLRDEGGTVSVVTVGGASALRRVVSRPLPYDEDAAREIARAAGADIDEAGPIPEVAGVEVGFFVPLPGSEDILVFTFWTMQSELADPLLALFDAIMETLRWMG